jgi:hypothetical protein
MRVTFIDGAEVELLNFSSVEQYSFLRAVGVAGAALGGKANLPTLKSDVIYVLRNPYDHPRYLTSFPFELIAVNAEENRPFQFLYQFAHEMGHLMAQAGLRIRDQHRHCWIEEAICGAYSIYCMRIATENGEDWVRAGAAVYLSEYIIPSYGKPEIVDARWYRENSSHLQQADRLTDKIKPLSWLIADVLDAGEFISDNVALINTPLTSNISAYFEEWERRCSSDKNVPSLLRDRLRPA